MNREEKAARISDLSEGIGQATNAFLIDFKGITVPQVTELRKQVRDTNSSYVVVKNTLALIAVKDSPLKTLEGAFSGHDRDRVQHDRCRSRSRRRSPSSPKTFRRFSSREPCSTGRSFRRARSRPLPICRRGAAHREAAVSHAASDSRPRGRSQRHHPQLRCRSRPDREAEGWRRRCAGRSKHVMKPRASARM